MLRDSVEGPVSGVLSVPDDSRMTAFTCMPSSCAAECLSISTAFSEQGRELVRMVRVESFDSVSSTVGASEPARPNSPAGIWLPKARPMPKPGAAEGSALRLRISSNDERFLG